MEEIAVREPEDIKERDKGGRPELYPTLVRPRFDFIYNCIAKGYTEQSICKKLGIHPFTWIRYKEEYKELSELVIRARTSAGELLLHKQYQKGSGHKVILSKQKVTKDGDVIDYKEEQYIPPDTNAADFWGRHMYPNYVAPKSDSSNNNIVVNLQLPEKVKEIEALDEEIKRLESALTVEYQVLDG